LYIIDIYIVMEYHGIMQNRDLYVVKERLRAVSIEQTALI